MYLFQSFDREGRWDVFKKESLTKGERLTKGYGRLMAVDAEFIKRRKAGTAFFKKRVYTLKIFFFICLMTG
jgi:hypothetical protein